MRIRREAASAQSLFSNLRTASPLPKPARMKRDTGQNREITRHWRPATRAVRGGTWRSEQGETSEAIFLSSGFSYDDAATPAARFAGEAEGMTYSRLQNPTVAMLEERIALMEGAEACREIGRASCRERV